MVSLTDSFTSEIRRYSRKTETEMCCGIEVHIENRKGTIRKKGWVPLKADYGCIVKTEGADGEKVDCFCGPNKDSEIVYVVDQTTKDGEFDEHKVMLGFDCHKEAMKCYRGSYPDDFNVGRMIAMTIDQFKAWLKQGDLKEPVQSQVSRYSFAQRGLFDDQGEGHWITIGAQENAEGEKTGGTPVYIKGGRMETGPFKGKTFGQAFGDKNPNTTHDMPRPSKPAVQRSLFDAPQKPAAPAPMPQPVPQPRGIIQPPREIPNEQVKPGQQLGLFGDAPVARAPKPRFDAQGSTAGKQQSLFDVKGNADQMLLFGDEATPDEMLFKPQGKAPPPAPAPSYEPKPEPKQESMEDLNPGRFTPDIGDPDHDDHPDNILGLDDDDDEQPAAEAPQEVLKMLDSESTRKIIAQAAKRMGVPLQDIDDVIQDVLLSAYNRMSKFDSSKGAFSTWINKTAEALIKNRWRDAKALKRGGGKTPLSISEQSGDSEKSTIEESIPDHRGGESNEFFDHLDTLKQHVAKLSDTERDILMSRMEKDEPFTSIGKRLGFSNVTAKNKFDAIIAKLKDLIGDDDNYALDAMIERYQMRCSIRRYAFSSMVYRMHVLGDIDRYSISVEVNKPAPLRSREFNESDHPRNTAGSPGGSGGKFTMKNGTEIADRPDSVDREHSLHLANVEDEPLRKRLGQHYLTLKGMKTLDRGAVKSIFDDINKAHREYKSKGVNVADIVNYSGVIPRWMVPHLKSGRKYVDPSLLGNRWNEKGKQPAAAASPQFGSNDAGKKKALEGIRNLFQPPSPQGQPKPASQGQATQKPKPAAQPQQPKPSLPSMTAKDFVNDGSWKHVASGPEGDAMRAKIASGQFGAGDTEFATVQGARGGQALVSRPKGTQQPQPAEPSPQSRTEGPKPLQPKQPSSPPGLAPAQPPAASGQPGKKGFGLTRGFWAGSTKGSMEFESEDHRDLFDLAGREKYRPMGKTDRRPKIDHRPMLENLAARLKMPEHEVMKLAHQIHDHTRAQMKGIKDGEHRKLTMNAPSPQQPEAIAPPMESQPEPAPAIPKRGNPILDTPPTPKTENRIRMVDFDGSPLKPSPIPAAPKPAQPPLISSQPFSPSPAPQPPKEEPVEPSPSELPMDTSFDPSEFEDAGDASFDPSSFESPAPKPRSTIPQGPPEGVSKQMYTRVRNGLMKEWGLSAEHAAIAAHELFARKKPEMDHVRNYNERLARMMEPATDKGYDDKVRRGIATEQDHKNEKFRKNTMRGQLRRALQNTTSDEAGFDFKKWKGRGIDDVAQEYFETYNDMLPSADPQAYWDLMVKGPLPEPDHNDHSMIQSVIAELARGGMIRHPDYEPEEDPFAGRELAPFSARFTASIERYAAQRRFMVDSLSKIFASAC